MDSSGVAELSINNKKIDFNENGEFIFSTFVPFDGVDIKIEAVDMAGISNSKIVNFKRKIKTTTNQFSFERLNPISKMVKKCSQKEFIILFMIQKGFHMKVQNILITLIKQILNI